MPVIADNFPSIFNANFYCQAPYVQARGRDDALAAELCRQAKLELDRLLEAGVESEQVEMRDEDWQALEARALARLEARAG